MTGETAHGLRGDYAGMRPDYTVEQDWAAYTADEHTLWRRLYARQAVLLPKYACREFIESVAALDFAGGIARFDEPSYGPPMFPYPHTDGSSRGSRAPVGSLFCATAADARTTTNASAAPRGGSRCMQGKTRELSLRSARG